MRKDKIEHESCYNGESIILATKHGKSVAIAPSFLEILGAKIIEYAVDTDQLGTFSGEIERQGNALECARKKCELPFNNLDIEVDFSIASEGSFGPHPFIPFISCNREILYFIDRKRGFHLYVCYITEKTNYRTGHVNSLEQLHTFATQTMFPSHALIVRPSNREVKKAIFKGIDTWQALEDAFKECLRHSEEGRVWIETDMRAQYNPSRMNAISELSRIFSNRLKTKCPHCNNPGWGTIRYEKGLRCGLCGSETDLVKSEVFGCVKCDYEENIESIGSVKKAAPDSCQYCNP